MRVVVAGGHGKIGLRVERLLTGRGDEASGLIRNPDQVPAVQRTGAHAVLCDLERIDVDGLLPHLDGADGVVFAAGAGPGSGPARKNTVDRGAAVLLAQACERAGVRRFLQISSKGAGVPPRPAADESWAVYITAKTEAEDDLRGRNLDWTILRPGILTDEPGTGLVDLAEPPMPHGKVSRDDVAKVVVALLDAPDTRHLTLEVIGGATPIRYAVHAVVTILG
ncbi:SDR family oxidoreductase [Rhizohabitans arisaemae]|uniref:SDR family oxidoreductase n=1 Tax=Rhizohabitans arisaemae TaxID=2720610 RepID=UPI0024B11BEB|nr:SDR family oxidoreductase [Rhizohabitans arisaemae]